MIHEPPATSPPASPGTSAALALIRARLGALRRRQVLVASLAGLALTLVTGLEVLALMMFLDWWLELPWLVRLVSLVAQAAVFGALLLGVVLKPLLKQPDEDELALMVERVRPEFRGRLIASVQLSRPGAVPAAASGALAGALIAETGALVAAAGALQDIVPTRRLRMLGTMAVVVPLAGLVVFLSARDTCIVLLRRALLSSEAVPRKTRILVPQGDRIIGVGDSVRLEAFAQGVLPRDGRVEIKGRTRRAQEFPLEQNRGDRFHFGRTLENVQESFSYQFALGDAISPIFEVRVLPRPAVAAIECEQEFPAYTGLKPVQRRPGDLTLLAGSTLRLKVTATTNLEAATLRLAGLDIAEPLGIDPSAPREVFGQFRVPVRGLTGFQILMRDTAGMENRDGAVYRVDILPDKPPQVRLTYPDRKEELLTRQATMVVGFEVADDFGVARLRLKYKSITVENGAEKSIELDLENASPARVRRRHEWRIADSLPGLPEGSVIEYWIEAEDNNRATGPGLGVSERQLIRLVSEAEKRADLLNRASDYLGSISDVVTDQERLNRNLGEVIRAKAGLR